METVVVYLVRTNSYRTGNGTAAATVLVSVVIAVLLLTAVVTESETVTVIVGDSIQEPLGTGQRYRCYSHSPLKNRPMLPLLLAFPAKLSPESGIVFMRDERRIS